jgi:hypothetical protein
LARHAMAVYDRATKAVLPEEQNEVKYSSIWQSDESHAVRRQKCKTIFTWVSSFCCFGLFQILMFALSRTQTSSYRNITI